LPRRLLDAVKVAVARPGVPHQRFIRQALEAAVQQRK
jgi:predicted DNA binding CopG/RHH family protein